MPKRIQRKRTRGWKMPMNTIYVGRRTIWGNPFKANDKEWGGEMLKPATLAVMFEIYAKEFQRDEPRIYREWLKPLRGRDLACWCKPSEPCHADVLLELANPARKIGA